MIAAMQVENGIGLAAPQLGVLKRVIVVAVPAYGPSAPGREPRKIGLIKHTLINPELVWTGGALTMGWEGCLSFPAPEEGAGKYRQVLVPRYPRIQVRGFSLRWEPVTIGAKGLVARAIQHEMDHLEGRTLAHYARVAHEVEKARKEAL
jgi:peptide deformylase